MTIRRAAFLLSFLTLSVTTAAYAQVPSAPSNLSATVAGFSVTLTWQAPSSGVVASYVLEVGSTPGAADLLVFDTGNSSTSFSAVAPAGTFFVRVRARGAGAVSAPSAETSLTVPTGGAGCTAPPSSFGSLLSYVANGNLVTFSWRPAPIAGRLPTSFLIEAGSFPLGSNLAQLTIPSSGQAVQSFSVAAPPGAYWVRMRGGNDCGAGPTSQEVLVLVGAGISSLTGRWKGLGRVQCAPDPLCRVRGEILWPLDLDLQQNGSVVTGTYYFQAVDAPTTAPESWGLVSGTLDANGSLNLTLTARGPAPFSPNPGGTFSATVAANRLTMSGTLFPIPQPNIPVQTPNILLVRIP